MMWEENFPGGFGHTSVSFLKRCPGFELAKNGDLNAAHGVVKKCIKLDRIDELKKKFPDAFLLPVLGRNTLAFAQRIGLPI